MTDPIALFKTNRAGPPQLDGGPRPAPTPAQGTSFADTLREAMPGPKRVTLSAHATQRLEQRGIRLDAEAWAAVDAAADALAAKGGREGLILGDDAAFVLNIPNRTVITVLSAEEAAGHVFTQIDSAAVLPRREAIQQEFHSKGPAPSQGSPDAADRQTRRPILEV